MANTYTQLHIHVVFAVKFRAALIQSSWQERLRLYISAIIQNNGHKMLAINNMPDHLHMFVGLNPAQSISEMMRLAKGDSSEWINKQRFTPQKFQWQDGYGAFSQSKSQVDSVVKYILNQQVHHRKMSFLDEKKCFMILKLIMMNATCSCSLWMNEKGQPQRGSVFITIVFYKAPAPSGAEIQSRLQPMHAKANRFLFLLDE